MDKKTDLVSVIVLTYRKFDLLEENLNSIYMQDYPNIEIIIGDDGSDNFDYDMINGLSLKKTDNIVNFKIIHNEKNLGTTRNANIAFSSANGKYLLPLSEDDVFADKNVISHIVDMFQKTNYNLITSKRIGRDSLKTFPEKRFTDFIEKSDSTDIFEALLAENFISGSVLYHKKEYWQSIGKFNESYRLLEDYPYLLESCKRGEKIGFLDEISIIYGEKGVSQKGKTNPIIVEEYKRTRLEYGIPFISQFKTRKMKRHFEYKKYQNDHKDSKGMLLLGYFCYLDHTVLMVYNYLLKHLKKDYVFYLDILGK